MPSRTRYSIIALAMVINLICYTDRSCISIAGPGMRAEFGFTPTQMGLVYSIFSLSYFMGQTPWGMLADRYGARGLVTLAILGWSVFTGMTALAWSFASLLVIRFVFGGLEAALSPSIAAAFNKWIPTYERSSAFGFFLGGGRLGAAITPFIAASALAAWGWRSVFLLFGGFGVAAAIVWFLWFRNRPDEHARVNDQELVLIRASLGDSSRPRVHTNWGELLKSTRLWCLLAVAFGCTFLWQFYITWFPTYLMEERKMSLQESARYAGLPFLFGVFATWLGGLLTDALSRRFDVRVARTLVGTTSLTTAGLLLSAGIWCDDPRMAAVLMASGALGVDLFLGAAWASALDIGGASGGAVAGLMNAASNLAGFVSPTFNGWVVETFHDWHVFLAVAIGVNWLAAVLWLFVNPRPAKMLPVAVAGLLCFPLLGVEKERPSPAPKVNAVVPAGMQRGASVEVELSGSNLEELQSVEFAGRGMRAEVMSAAAGKAKMRITAAADAEIGRRDFRLTTARGSYVGVFFVGPMAERNEAEPNDDWRKPEPLTLPATVNGIVANEDWDHFAFDAAAGATYTFDVVATRNSSRLDAELAILDAAGNELAWNDDATIFGDPQLVWTAPKAGRYVVRVGSLGGGATATYRLVAGVVPFVTEVLPAGVQRAVWTDLRIRGRNLGSVRRVWIGDAAAECRVLRASAEALHVQVRTALAAGSYWLHMATDSQELPVPLPVRVSDLPEATYTGTPVAISQDMVLNGALTEPRQEHRYRIEAKAGEVIVLQPESMKLGYHADPFVAVLDADGRKLAYADDPGVDDRADEYQIDADLAFAVPKDGSYFVMIRDSMYRGGDQMVYRLTVRRAQPDFLLELREPVKSAYTGQALTVQARVRRRGWTTPVEVWLEDVPDGVQVEKQTAEPKNTIVKDTCGVDRELDGSLVLLPVRIESAKAGRYHWRLKARGTMNGRTVDHTGIVRYENLSAGYTYGPMQVQQADLTIVEAP